MLSEIIEFLVGNILFVSKTRAPIWRSISRHTILHQAKETV